MVRRVVGVVRQQAIGLVALFVALGGTSYAVATNSIDSRELKNNSIRTQDVRNRSLLERDFKRGQLKAGPQGPRGAAGSAGPAGPPGATGPTGPEGTPATRMFARVAGINGALATASGVTSATRAGLGDYSVNFSRSVTGCAVVATAGVGLPAGEDAYQVGSRATIERGTTDTQVRVRTVSNSDTIDDRSFFIAAFC